MYTKVIVYIAEFSFLYESTLRILDLNLVGVWVVWGGDVDRIFYIGYIGILGLGDVAAGGRWPLAFSHLLHPPVLWDFL